MGNKPQKQILPKSTEELENSVFEPREYKPCVIIDNKKEIKTEKIKKKVDRRSRILSVTNLFTDITNYYTIGQKELGHGNYGIVREAIDKKTKEKVAVKSIYKIKVNDLESLRNELNIMRTLRHPNIVRFICVHEDEDYLHIVMELCTGGELFDKLIEKSKFMEKEAAQLMKGIFSAVAYCHSKAIVHRDLKPENFIYLNNQVNSPIKIIDFGLSKIYVFI